LHSEKNIDNAPSGQEKGSGPKQGSIEARGAAESPQELKMIHKVTIPLLILLGIGLLMFQGDAFSFVTREEGKSYIVDRGGHRWDVTQAESIGFKPEGFQYGLGKDAFTPLDGGDLTENTADVSPFHRVIGISEGGEAQAYSVPKLAGHEIANSRVGDKPIAAAY
jgi:hypothetical protein